MIAAIESTRALSEDIVAFLAARASRDPASMRVYRNYVDGSFAMAMKLLEGKPGAQEGSVCYLRISSWPAWHRMLNGVRRFATS